MPVRGTLYPKTTRIGDTVKKIIITEKLDGSNLGIFNLGGSLLIAQRNWMFHWNPEVTDLDKTSAYKGLIGWLEENGKYLIENMHEGSGVFGEWMGMGKLDYSQRLDKRFYIFAKANILFEDETFKTKNIYYNPSLFIYPFTNQEIPPFMGVVPKVAEYLDYPTLDELDDLYAVYLGKLNPTESEAPFTNNVEGFVINDNDNIRKYVRFKNGVMTPHTVKGD